MKTLGLDLLKMSWIAGFILMSVTGCGGKDSSQSLLPLRVGDQDLVAKYNDGRITMKDAAEWYSLFGDSSKALDLESNETAWVQETVRNMIIEKVFAKEARELKLDESEAMLNKKKDFTNRAISKLYIRRHLVNSIEISDREIQSYFYDHRKEYGTPEKFSFYMIFFDAEKHGREKARRRAEQLLERIHAGAPFESLIVENSDIPEHQRAGEFGPYEVGEGLIPAIEEAAVKLKVGEVSDLIEHKKGFHIIKLSNKMEAYEPKLEDMRQVVHDALFYEKLSKAEDRLLYKEKENLDIQENYHIIGLPITSVNDVVLKIEDRTMTYGQYIEMVREGSFQTEDELQAELMRRYANMVYEVLGRRLGYDQDPDILRWVDLNMQRELTFVYLNDVINPQAIVPEEEIREVYEKSPSLYKYPKNGLCQANLYSLSNSCGYGQARIDSGD